MFRSIMVPLDVSTLAYQALGAAKAMARRSGAIIHLVHVRTSSPTLLLDEGEEPEHAYLRITAEELMEDGFTVRYTVVHDELAPLLRADQPARTTADALQRYIVDHDIDLVIMSSHGHGGIRRAWLGSVADAMLRQSPVPVLIVRPRRGARERELPLHRILVPLDGSPLAEAAVEPAIALAAMSGGHLILLRCVEPIRAPANPYTHWVLPPLSEIEEMQRKSAEAYLLAMLQRVRSASASVTVELEVVVQSAPAGILDAARRHEADVIAMATHGAGGAKRLLLGSVADKVVRTTTVPVLTVRASPVEIDANAAEAFEAVSSGG